MKKLIVILGMHKSGTSLMTQMIQETGAYLGKEDNLLEKDSSNPDGHFENLDILYANNDILHSCDREWYNLEVLNFDYSDRQTVKGMEKLKRIIQELFQKSNVVAIKDPRISVLLPVWERILTELEVEVHYVWMFRNPLEVMESLRKRNGYCSRHVLLMWIHYNLSILKFLKGKKYLLMHYKDILSNASALERLREIFDSELNEDLGQKWKSIVKREYCHSEYFYHDVKSRHCALLTDLYGALLKNQEEMVNIKELENHYIKAIAEKQDKFIDYEVLENIKLLEEKEIIIYGAGNCGRQAAEMLEQLGFLKYNFCDKDIHKQGMEFMNGSVFSIAEMENRKNLLFIVAIEDATLRKEAEYTLTYIKEACFLTFFVLKIIWKYFAVDYSTVASQAEAFSSLYKRMQDWSYSVKEASLSPVLVYQSGKVASSTIASSLQKAGIKNLQVHRFFFKKNEIWKLVLGDEHIEFIENLHMMQMRAFGNLQSLKDEMNGKKIITLVREPIAVDLSQVFQWIGNGVADRYFAKNLKFGKSFTQVVSELMVRIQDRLIHWFDEELKELCGIDIFHYSFDQERGYTIISENGVEVLLIKVEKIDQMTEIIRNFVGNSQLELVNDNIGKNKEYAQLYESVKKNLKLPKEYVEHYYKNNFFMNHFYSKEEQNAFLNKWMKYTT